MKASNSHTKMASKRKLPISYDTLISVIPFVIDFLDLDCDEILASGILDDDHIDDAVTAMVMCHKKAKSQARQESGPKHKEQSLQLDSPSSVTGQQIRTPNIVTVSGRIIDQEFRTHFRMTPTMVETLLQNMMMLTSFGKRRRKNHCETTAESTYPSDSLSSALPCEPSVMLLLTLRFLGSTQTTKQLADVANMTESVLNDTVSQTLDALYELMQFYIKWPEMCNVNEVSEYFQQKYTLPNVLGTINVLHIKAKTPDEHKDYYTNHCGETSVILQTVCDHKYRFIHCSTGWPGSVDEATVFHDSDLYSDVPHKINKYFPCDFYIVGTEAYPLIEWLMKPYSESGNLTVPQRRFNTACCNIYRYSTTAHRYLISRFPRLEFVEMESMERKVITILVCCALHNFCIDRRDAMFETTRAVTSLSSMLSSKHIDSEQGEQKRQRLLQCFNV